MTAKFDYSGKAVLVTGGSSGIGRAIAVGFRDAGAAVTVLGTRGGPEDYPDELSGMTYRQLDMTDNDGILALATEMPALGVLVNSAGTTVRGPAAFEPDNFEYTVQVNLNGAYRISHAFREQLAASGGSIVNIASMTSYFSSPRGPGYGASKAGILQLTQSLASAWASDGIRVNGIAPGWIATKLTAPVQANEPVNRKIIERTPMGRWGQPEEMAGTALFLASDAAGFVTGVTIPVDGGWSAEGV